MKVEEGDDRVLARGGVGGYPVREDAGFGGFKGVPAGEDVAARVGGGLRGVVEVEVIGAGGRLVMKV